MIQYCDLKTEEFNSCFLGAIDKNRHNLLISNHLKRLFVILTELNRRAEVFLDLLSSDIFKEENSRQALGDLHQNAARLEAIVANSMEGAIKGLKEEIDFNMKEIFFKDSAQILKKIQTYTQAVSIEVETYRSVSGQAGINQILYFMFQDFQRNLSMYVIEEINPILKQCVAFQEDRIKLYFQSLFDSYQVELIKSDYGPDIKDGSELSNQQKDLIDSVDIEKIKKILGLQLPGRIFEAKYTPRIKANAFTDFGLQIISQLFTAMFQKKSGFSFSPGLKKAVAKIKKENQKIFMDQFEKYHINLRINYFLPLIEAATRDFKEKINDRFRGYQSFNEEIEQIFSLKRSEKDKQKEKTIQIKQRIEDLVSDITSYFKFHGNRG